MKHKKCIHYNEIRKNEKYENWPEFCWPNFLFTESDYPCRHCSIQKERYSECINEYIKIALENKNDVIHSIIESCNKDSGKLIRFKYSDNVGLLIGACTTLEDYYWVYIDKDKNVQFYTCVSGYEVLDHYIEGYEWLCDKRNKNEIINIVQQYMNNSIVDKMITKIYES